MKSCKDKYCSSIGNTLCLCELIFYCEKHLKEHLQTESKRHNFEIYYNTPNLTTKNGILNLLSSIITFSKKHKYSQIISDIEEGSYSSTELSQNLKEISKNINYCQNLFNEIDSCQEISLNTATYFQSLLFFPITVATKLMYQHLSDNIPGNFLYEEKSEMFESKYILKMKFKINQILLIEKQMKNIIKNQTNIKLPNFNITTKLLDDSKQYWDGINELKSKIKLVKNDYESSNCLNFAHSWEVSKDLFGNLDHDNLKNFYDYIYNEFLITVSSFQNILNQKEKDLSIHRGKIVYSIYRSLIYSYTIIIPFDGETIKFEYNEIDREKFTRKLLIDISSCLTAIPNSGLFAFGRIYTPWSEKSYAVKIDTKFQMKIIENSLNRTYPGCAYYQNCVYIFGGSWGSNTGLSIVEKFNLEADKWFKLSPLPLPSYSCACIVYNQSILLSGINLRKVYKYDIGVDGYSEIFDDLNPGNKVIFYAYSRIYIIEQPGAIYESEGENEFVWNKIDSSFMHPLLGQTFWVLHKNSIYFSQTDGARNFYYYRFNLQAKKFKILKSIPIRFPD